MRSFTYKAMPLGLIVPLRAVSTVNFKTDYFSLFDVHRRAAINVADLRRRYHEFQAEHHPDILKANSATGPGTDPSDASAFASAAYNTLKDPYGRCRYLLLLLDADDHTLESARPPLTPAEYYDISRGHDISEHLKKKERVDEETEDPRLGHHKDNVSNNPEFLMEMMHLNERLLEINDMPRCSFEQKEAFKEFKEDIQERNRQFEEECLDLYEKIAPFLEGPNSSSRLQNDMYTIARDAFRDNVLKWTYVNNLKHQVTALE